MMVVSDQGEAVVQGGMEGFADVKHSANERLGSYSLTTGNREAWAAQSISGQSHHPGEAN